MSLQFSRSLRSLNIDSYRTSRVALILAIINMIILLGWFAFGTVTLYEIGSEIRLSEDGSLAAKFPIEAVARLVPGQSGVLRIDAGQDQPLITAPVLLIDVDKNTGEATFLLMSDDLPESVLSADLSSKAELEVEVEYVSPLTLVMRASGKYLGGRQIPVSPQELQNTDRQ